MTEFTYTSVPHRVVFGAGRLDGIAREVDELGCRRAFIITTPGRRHVADRAADLLGDRRAAVHDGAAPHVPEQTVRDAVRAAKACGADLLVAVGGGSVVGLAKGVALETGLPILAVPTTYAGSEMTRIWGISRDGSGADTGDDSGGGDGSGHRGAGRRKKTGRDPVVLPACVIYDPELLASLPPAVSLVSGINAMAHAVEALYAADATPVSAVLAEESVRRLGRSLPRVVGSPGDIAARADSLAGAMLAAMVLDQVGMGIHHKLCHVLGGSFGLEHAATHTVLLPYALAFNAAHAPGAVTAVGRALGVDAEDAPGAIRDITLGAGGPVSLRELGLLRGDLPVAAEEACRDPYPNPRDVEVAWVLDLLERAFDGERP